MLANLWRDLLAQRSQARRKSGTSHGLNAALWQERRAALAPDDQTSRRALLQELDAVLNAALARDTRAGRPYPVELLPGWRLLGDWLWQLGDYVPAEAAYRQALRCHPMDAKSQEGLGLSLLHLQRLDEAWLHFEIAHRAAPMDSDVLTHWGLVDLELGHLPAACERFQQAIERNPRNPHAWHNLGLAALRMGDRERCIGHLRKCLEIKPDHGLGWSNLAMALRMVEDLPGAQDAARRATDLKGHNNARVWSVRGDVAGDAGDFDAALDHARHALCLDPGHVNALVLLGKLHTALGRHDEAQAAYRQVLDTLPDHAEARGGLGQLLLLEGRWSEGWALYESRRHATYQAVRELPIPPWDGHEDLHGRRLLVHAEQGLGDVIIFASCLNELVQTGAEITVEVPPRMASLMQRSFPDLQVLGHDYGDTGLAWLGEPPVFDRELAIGSLPLHFRPDRASFGQGAAFLRADAARVAQWRAQFMTTAGPVFVLGISWRGGLLRTAGQQRSIELDAMLDALHGVLAQAPCTVELVCLQHGVVDDEIAAAQARTGLRIHRGPQHRADLDEIATATCACDAVLTVCSTQAHLTGGLGRKGLVLVPANPNWRYGATGEHMPWYGSLTLVRQQQLGQWAPALEQAAQWVGQQLAAAAREQAVGRLPAPHAA
jgi:tetratricopeptide (TPR) repeat protein